MRNSIDGQKTSVFGVHLVMYVHSPPIVRICPSQQWCETTSYMVCSDTLQGPSVLCDRCICRTDLSGWP